MSFLSDPYLYPGTKVLANKFDVIDQDRLGEPELIEGDIFKTIAPSS
jgi:hypothetical protein